MLGSELLEVVKQFQTIIVGVVGFVGVIWTLHANSKNARDEHRRLEAGRRTALRRLLAAELRNYARALKANAEAHPMHDGVLSVGRIHRLFSENLTADLGLLDLDEIDVVVNALISLDGLEHVLENMASRTTETRFILHPEAVAEFQKVSSKAAKALEYAVQALEYSGDA